MKSKLRVVFDTNIYISAIIFGGNPRTCLELAKNGKIEVYTSREILFELSQKLKKKFAWNDYEVADVIQGLSKFVKIVKPKEKIFVIAKDPTDNKILECAKEVGTDFIVSGDVKHILILKQFERTKIVKAEEFLKKFYK